MLLSELLNIKLLTINIINYFKDNPSEAKLLYDQLIANSLQRGLDKSLLEGYYEKHHIIPKSIGGTDNNNNYVLLTYKEHVLAHLLLYASTSGEEKIKLLAAFKLMIEVSDKKDLEDISVDIDSITYTRKEFSDHLSTNNPMKDPEIVKKQRDSVIKNGSLDKIRESLSKRLKEHNPMYNEEAVEKMRQSKIGSKASDEAKKHLSEARLGKELTEKHKQRISESRKNANIHLSEDSINEMRNSKNSDVVSPDGKIYHSLSDAAAAIHISRTTLKEWIMNSPEKGWKMIPKSEESKKQYNKKLSETKKGKMPRGKDNSRATKVKGPDGKIYDTLKDAAEAAGVDRTTMNRWLRGKTKHISGWNYLK